MKVARVKWLGNHGLSVIYRQKGGAELKQFVPGSAAVPAVVALKALNAYPAVLHRMRRSGTIGTRRSAGRTLYPITELLRVLSQWRALGYRTARIAKPVRGS